MKHKRWRVVLLLAAWVVTAGCSALQKSVSENSWSQTAAREERQQQLNTAPAGEWSK